MIIIVIVVVVIIIIIIIVVAISIDGGSWFVVGGTVYTESATWWSYSWIVIDGMMVLKYIACC